MIISIHQPNYIPWLGYFSKINKSDIFVFLDDVQYEKGGVTNKNKILMSNGETINLVVPVSISKGYQQKINEIEIIYQEKWQHKHLSTVKNNYSRAKYFETYFESYAEIVKAKYLNIADFNKKLILWICAELEIDTKIFTASEMDGIKSTKNQRNIDIVKLLNGSKYLSGIGAKSYNDETAFNSEGISLEYHEYNPVSYRQLYSNKFIPNLSAIDALFNVGKQTIELLK